MTADYYRDLVALKALIAKYPNDDIKGVIKDAEDAKAALDNDHKTFDDKVKVYCGLWNQAGSGAGKFLIREALETLEPQFQNMPHEIQNVLRPLLKAIKDVSGGGGGGNTAWPSNYVSSSS
jgi:hypothetical protein